MAGEERCGKNQCKATSRQISIGEWQVRMHANDNV